MTLADHVFIGPFNFIEASSGVRLEEGVQITSHVSIVTHSSHRACACWARDYVNWPATQRPGCIAGPVHIGAYSFIGPHCADRGRHAPGPRHAGRAGSLVRGEFPDFAVIAGSPARSWATRATRDEALLQRTRNCVRTTRPGPGRRQDRCAMRLVLWGDGESPHLLKWARALAPRVELWAASSRGFAAGIRRCGAGRAPAGAGHPSDARRRQCRAAAPLPRLARWLRRVEPTGCTPTT